MTAPREGAGLLETPLNFRVVEGANGVHVEGHAVARVVAEVQQPSANGRCIIYVFGDRREEIAPLLALAPDHALWGAAVAAGEAQLDPSRRKSCVVEIQGRRSWRSYPTTLDAFGCPVLTDELRSALRKVVGSNG